MQVEGAHPPSRHPANPVLSKPLPSQLRVLSASHPLVIEPVCRLVDKGSGELLASYQGHVHQAVKLDCCLTPSDAHVVGGSESGEVLYWDLVESEVVKRFTAHGGVVCSLAMHPSGEMLLTSSVDGTMKVWQV